MGDSQLPPFSMPTDRPTPKEVEELAARLTPEELLLLPFYHDLENELKQPERVRIQTEYFWRHWAPELGPTLTVLVITLRSYCYYNKLTKEKRDWAFPKQETLAQQIGVSRKTVLRTLQNPAAAHFIKREPRYRYDPATQKKVRTAAARASIRRSARCRPRAALASKLLATASSTSGPVSTLPCVT